MSLIELKATVMKLPPKDRLALAAAIIESLHDTTISVSERAKAIETMRELLKTDQLAPSDQEIAAILDQRRVEKYIL
ncbi:hypothetical protein [Synechococcus sp. PCC 6312]|uniref:hypothetical protein n=1 Tax=Synechococcus sp. (strain ATCC 27167 / PCC 6312) TaxID=195253 RepID=UPI00029F351A|nr:hypothetical protein [Synechococcus sp. PCC 6312]AFY61193.1 hypothetical protein Syn6312_2065 [Synechococcus sp. PCC 6312]